jgi:hypothetical protein
MAFFHSLILMHLIFIYVCRGGMTYDPEDALAFLSKHCKWAVVTLASKGCIAKHGKQVRLKRQNINNVLSIFRPVTAKQ